MRKKNKSEEEDRAVFLLAGAIICWMWFQKMNVKYYADNGIWVGVAILFLVGWLVGYGMYFALERLRKLGYLGCKEDTYFGKDAFGR